MTSEIKKVVRLLKSDNFFLHSVCDGIKLNLNRITEIKCGAFFII